MSQPFFASRRVSRPALSCAFRRGILLASCAFFLAATIQAADFGLSPGQGRRQALLIGNSAYQKNSLPNPVNDARDFGAMLKEAGFEAMVRTDLDLRGMETAVREFSASLRQGDTVLVFYAGHGVESGGINYLIPVDNAGLESEADLKYKAYAASRILDEAATRKAGLVMLILDACRDNPFPSRSGAGSRGLTVMAGPAQLESLILYSTAPGTTAADGLGRNSVFMRSLLAEIQAPNLSVRDVFDRVGGAVKAATGGAQVPWLNSTPMSKPFIFFSGAEAEARATALGAKAQEDLAAQRARIAELEAARAKAKDEAARQGLDTELVTARAIETAKKLESDRLIAESARLAEERKKTETAIEARKNLEASEASRAETVKEEAARLKKEYESLVRVDDSAPEFIRQINSLEKALKEIRDRYEAMKKDGEKGIAAVYVQKTEALKASFVMEPWETEKEFTERTQGTYTALDRQRIDEQRSYSDVVDADRGGQEKDLAARLAKVSSQFASSTYTQSGSSILVNVGAFDREAKSWPIQIASALPDFHFQAELRYSIASAPDIGSAYRTFDTAYNAGALAAEIEYGYDRRPGEEYVAAKAARVRIKDLTTGKVAVSAQSDAVLFYLASESPGKRLGLPVLKLSGAVEGTAITVHGERFEAVPKELTILPGSFTIVAAKPGYEEWKYSGTVNPGQRIDLVLSQVVSNLLSMVLVPGGSFSMGSASGDADEKPIHQVTVSSFMLGKYEVTQEQYQLVMGTNPSNFKSGSDAPSRPVEQVKWYDAVAFCNALSAKEGLAPVYTIKGTSVSAEFSKYGYRLPTEAEWEYAARGGPSSRGYTYSGSNDVGQVAWYSSNSGSSTHVVGTKAPNELGLYDMSGNVWEWCWDWYDKSYYSASQAKDPLGAASGAASGASSGGFRVIRGGSWFDSAEYLRSAYRDNFSPGISFYLLGFRVLRRP